MGEVTRGIVGGNGIFDFIYNTLSLGYILQGVGYISFLLIFIFFLSLSSCILSGCIPLTLKKLPIHQIQVLVS